ncbi:MAG TPA: hypothetical protein PKY82_19580 [Pyrinomonadaceae bacterium]|nr:hypothetical protein [Pyrinomonadaceae bacterium]
MNEIIYGHIQVRRVRCGKANCKCAKGEKHQSFYHVWYSNGKRYQKYIRQSKVENIQNACITQRKVRKSEREKTKATWGTLRQIREQLRELTELNKS